MPVLYGVFLYMGVSSLKGIQVMCNISVTQEPLLIFVFLLHFSKALQNCQANITELVIYINPPSLPIFTTCSSFIVPSFLDFPLFGIRIHHILSSLTVWSCLACRRSISQTLSTCAMSPWGRCTCSLLPSSPASCCSGSSRHHLLLSYSPWWQVDHRLHPPLFTVAPFK